MLDQMSQGNRTQWNYFLDMEMIEFMNYYSYMVDKNRWEKYEHDKINSPNIKRF